METAEYKFGQVASAVGISPNTLRSWFQRGQVESHRERAKRWGHVLYTDGDVLFFVLVSEMTKYGVPVDQAFKMVRAAGDSIKQQIHPSDDFVLEMMKKTLVINQVDGQWQCSTLSVERIAGLSSFIAINVDSCAMPAFEKLWPGHGLTE